MYNQLCNFSLPLLYFKFNCVINYAVYIIVQYIQQIANTYVHNYIMCAVVKSEWINCPEQPLSPPMMYFDETKYFAWSFNTELAEVLKEQ